MWKGVFLKEKCPALGKTAMAPCEKVPCAAQKQEFLAEMGEEAPFLKGILGTHGDWTRMV